MKIEGSSAIVCGGASGLGAATAEMLVMRGCKVTIVDFDSGAGEAKASDLGCLFFKADVTEEASVHAALSAAEQAHGVARVLVNCAGIAPPQKTVNREGTPHDLALFRKVMEVNVVGSFNMLSKFAARLADTSPMDGERGVIINTASIAAFDGQVGQAAYAASKSAIVGLTLPVARDLAQLGIRIMTIAPGIFLTPMLAGLPMPAQESLGQQVPFPNRLGKPAEFASLVEAIITNPMLNGETIRLDGALRMAPR